MIIAANQNGIPLKLDEPCPICGKAVYLTGVDEWETESGVILHAEYDCETEPDIDGDEWWDWHNEHYRTPYIDWLPYEQRMLAWLKARYRFDGERLKAQVPG